MGNKWGIRLLATTVAATSGGCARHDKDAEFRKTLANVGAGVGTGNDERVSAARTKLAMAAEAQRVRAATRPTTGPAARWLRLRCRLEFTADSGPLAALQQGELFALAGKTFRVTCREDLSTVLTLPDGAQLTVEDGTAAMVLVANAEFLAKAADIAQRGSDPKLAVASMLRDSVTRLMIEQAVARAGLSHLPSALAAALDERRSAGVDAKPLADVIVELLEMEESGFPAGWRTSSNNRVRIRFDDATRKALIDLVLP